MADYIEIKNAEDRVIEAAASLVSFLEDIRAGERLDNVRHRQLVERLKSTTDEYARMVCELSK